MFQGPEGGGDEAGSRACHGGARRGPALAAPSKRLVRFERSGHHVTSEKPGKLLETLVSVAHPIAVRAGDAAPDGP